MPDSTHLGHTVALEPGAARERISEAYVRARCSMAETARALGVGRVTLYRYVVRLGLQGALEEIGARAKLEGWHHGRTGGRPPGSRNKRAAGSTRRGSPLDSKGARRR